MKEPILRRNLYPSEVASRVLEAEGETTKRLEDYLEVATIIQLFDWATSPADLKRIGRKVARTDLAEVDREALRVIYAECMQSFKRVGKYTPEPERPLRQQRIRKASSSQKYLLKKLGYEGLLDKLTRYQASHAIEILKLRAEKERNG